jgi:murein DD-endopeptidase MepM/ murein hydrolase activator NlpD
VATTTALLVTMPPGIAWAQSQDDLEQAEEDAAAALEHATEREREAARQYKEATDALPEAEAKLEAAGEKVDEAEAALELADDEVTAAEEALDRAALRYDGLQNEVDGAEDRLGAIAATAYKTGGMYSIAAVLTATGPQDVIKRLGFVERVSAHEDDALTELTAAQTRAGTARDEADGALQRADDAQLDAQGALDAARAAERDAAEAADEVTALVDAQAEALAVAEEEREKAEAELAQVEEELRAWEQANLDTAAELESGLTLLMPVDGVKTSDFGPRINPVTGEDGLHSGVDFAAPGGAPISAAAAGTVIQAGWYGGYGNFTCLSHGTYQGQGLSTCYAHQSEILVSAGQAVQAGELIGRVGTTGNSTGDHLHFEVRLDGTPTDPLPWLPDCLC